jgi:hypothetical protein
MSASRRQAPRTIPLAINANSISALARQWRGRKGDRRRYVRGSVWRTKGRQGCLCRVKDPILAAAKGAFEKGEITSPEDLRPWVGKNYTKVKPVIKPEPAPEPQVDTTGWLPEEKAELDAANADVAKAQKMQDAYDHAAMCIKNGGG